MGVGLGTGGEYLGRAGPRLGTFMPGPGWHGPCLIGGSCRADLNSWGQRRAWHVGPQMGLARAAHGLPTDPLFLLFFF